MKTKMTYTSFILLIGLFLPLSNLLHAQSSLGAFLCDRYPPEAPPHLISLFPPIRPTSQPLSVDFRYPTASVGT